MKPRILPLSLLVQESLFDPAIFAQIEHEPHGLDLEQFPPDLRLSREKREVLDLQVTSQCR